MSARVADGAARGHLAAVAALAEAEARALR